MTYNPIHLISNSSSADYGHSGQKPSAMSQVNYRKILCNQNGYSVK